MPARDVVDPERLATRWLFELQQSAQQLAERTNSDALVRWADRLRAQLATCAAGDPAARPHQPRSLPHLDDPLDVWIAGRLLTSANAPDAVAGLAQLGFSSQQIANAHGADISDSAVQSYAQRVHQITFQSRWQSPAFIEAIRAAHDQGLTPRTIAVRIQSSRRPIEKLVGPLPGRRQRHRAKTDQSADADDNR